MDNTLLFHNLFHTEIQLMLLTILLILWIHLIHYHVVALEEAVVNIQEG